MCLLLMNFVCTGDLFHLKLVDYRMSLVSCAIVVTLSSMHCSVRAARWDRVSTHRHVRRCNSCFRFYTFLMKPALCTHAPRMQQVTTSFSGYSAVNSSVFWWWYASNLLISLGMKTCGVIQWCSK
jgi:hypothetical protein